MITFIPLHLYVVTYYALMLFFIGTLCVMLWTHPKAVVAQPGIRNQVVQMWGWACLVLLIVLLGLRPISFAFGDMGNYYKHFLAYEAGKELGEGDIVFESALWLFANYANAALFFFFCTVLYLVPIAVTTRKLLDQYWPLAFFMVAAHVDFYGYGVNGIRQGVASSVFLLALVTPRPLSWALVACSVGLHGGFILPAAAFVLTGMIKDPRLYFAGWLACLAATSAWGGFGEAFATAGIGGEALDKYMTTDQQTLQQFSKVGFRFDFLAYSAIPIVIGYYFVIVRKFRDAPYLRMLSIYLTCNAVWLLMIRTTASNRVAYLSWFMMGLVIAYPLIKWRAFRGQHIIFVCLLLVLFGYTVIHQL